MIKIQNEFKIKFAVNKNLAHCVRLSRISWPMWWAKNGKAGREHIKNRIKGKTVLVAVRKQEIVAFLSWGTLWTKIHIEDIFVKEECRKHGLGTMLMKRAMEIAKERGFKEVTSDCGVTNKISLKFHLADGFKKCGYIRHEWGKEDSHIFSRKL